MISYVFLKPYAHGKVQCVNAMSGSMVSTIAMSKEGAIQFLRNMDKDIRIVELPKLDRGDKVRWARDEYSPIMIVETMTYSDTKCSCKWTAEDGSIQESAFPTMFMELKEKCDIGIPIKEMTGEVVDE